MAVSVLIVEDDKNIAELLQLYLEKEGYAVTVAYDGGKGLEKFRAIHPDLVLLDLMMPVMDGWEVCKAIREAGYTFASYTYNNIDYGKRNANEIQADITNWTAEVLPILGEAQTLVYAKSSDISTTGDYTGSKYTVLYNAGFRYFITSGTNPTATINGSYVRQVRLMVTGTNMANAASTYAQYFNAASLLNSQRGNVPQ